MGAFLCPCGGAVGRVRRRRFGRYVCRRCHRRYVALVEREDRYVSAKEARRKR